MDSATVGVLAATVGVPIVLAYLRRAGRRVVPHEPPVGVSEARAQLRERGWFFRKLVVTVDGREYRVDYDGGGAGERVVVDGRQVAFAAGVASLVPRFEFPIADHRGLIELDVRWFVMIKGFRLSLDRTVIYREGTFAS